MRTSVTTMYRLVYKSYITYHLHPKFGYHLSANYMHLSQMFHLELGRARPYQHNLTIRACYGLMPLHNSYLL